MNLVTNRFIATTGPYNRGIDTPFAKTRGITISGTGGAGNPVLEHIWALILSSVIKLFRGAVTDWPTRVIYIVVLALSAVSAFVPMPIGVLGAVLGYVLSPVALVILSGAAGLCVRLWKGGHER